MYGGFLVIFFLALFFVFILRRYADVWGFIDVPNERSAHEKHTPRAAGIGFFLAIMLVLPCFYFEYLISHYWTLLAILLVFIVGILDDHHDTSPNSKFIVIILATLFLYFDHLFIDDIGIFFGTSLSLGWFALPVTIFAVVGFTNALNLIDGLDGLAASLSMVILVSFYFIGFQHQDMFIMLFSGATISALLAFLVFNWHPASIFMGDSGSLTLGFIISVLAIKSIDYISAVTVLFIAAIPILDTIIVMTRRKLNGHSMFAADHYHLHHILKKFFDGNVPKTVTFLIVLQSIYSLTALQLNKEIDSSILLLLFILNIVLLYLILAAMIKRQKRFGE